MDLMLYLMLDPITLNLEMLEYIESILRKMQLPLDYAFYLSLIYFIIDYVIYDKDIRNRKRGRAQQNG